MGLKCNCPINGVWGNPHALGKKGCERRVALEHEIPKNHRRMETEYGPIMVWDLNGEIVTDTKVFNDLGYIIHRGVPAWSVKKNGKEN